MTDIFAQPIFVNLFSNITDADTNISSLKKTFSHLFGVFSISGIIDTSKPIYIKKSSCSEFHGLTNDLNDFLEFNDVYFTSLQKDDINEFTKECTVDLRNVLDNEDHGVDNHCLTSSTVYVVFSMTDIFAQPIFVNLFSNITDANTNISSYKKTFSHLFGVFPISGIDNSKPIYIKKSSWSEFHGVTNDLNDFLQFNDGYFTTLQKDDINEFIKECTVDLQNVLDCDPHKTDNHCYGPCYDEDYEHYDYQF